MLLVWRSLEHRSWWQFDEPTSQLAGRAIIGLAFDPNNANNLWLSHNDPLFPQPAQDFSGKISKLTLRVLILTLMFRITSSVPRSAKDHLSNSLAFGPDGKLYSQGSNSAMGAPDLPGINGLSGC